MDNTKLIVEARSWARGQLPEGPWGEKHVVHRLADALEAAEAVTERVRVQRDANLLRSVQNYNRARLAEQKIDAAPHDQVCDTRYDFTNRPCNCWKSIRSFSAAAPVSLEAVKAETTTEWAETTEYAYGHLDAPDTIVATGEDIDDRGSAECNAEEFWAQVLERTVRRSEWRPVSTEGGDRV